MIRNISIGDFVSLEYDNGKLYNGEVEKIKMMGDRMLLTVKIEDGYRSLYLDKCVTFDVMQAAN